MANRPYSKSRVEELEALALASAQDAVVLRNLLLELECRKTPRAVKLRQKVQEALTRSGDGASKPSATAAPNRAKPVAASGPRPQAAAVADAAFYVPLTDPEVAQCLKALRDTFTPRGELLARWGMTESLPDELIEVVIREWKRLLKNPEAAQGRSSRDLDRDFDRIVRRQPPASPSGRQAT